IGKRVDSWFHDALASKLPYPVIASIEPVSNMCQLKCPLCPTGTKNLNYDCKIMSLETFKIILEKMPFIKMIDLYKSGEPFLNPDIFSMIRYATEREIEVIISTNFSFAKPDGFFEDIVTSGLRKLVISLDGASQESYSQYRIGGNYELVMANIKKLLDVKKRLRSKCPEIVWQFLVNRFNEHEIPLAQKIAREINITLDIRPMDLLDELPDVELDGTLGERMRQWLPTNKKYICDRYQGEHRYPLFPGICTQLFARLVVTSDGKILPCCETWDKNSVFGDLLADSFKDIWHNRNYLNSRARFLIKDFNPKEQTVCFKCRNFGTTPSFTDKAKLLAVVLLRPKRLSLIRAIRKKLGFLPSQACN
ncbi:MAG: radical SAM protein, partial [Desulfobulbaceae bacterium]|nr:radical SAM protein [Desulfobulbaceae bacterium]